MRQSNFELLRIVAMLLVLTVHAGFYSLGMPTEATGSLACLTRIFFQSVSVIAVLLFVLISGWFGIRTKVRSVLRFVSQCLFYSVILFLVMLCLGKAKFDWKSIQNVLLFVNSFWFVKAYLMLMILAPILNAFVDSVEERPFRWMLVAFFVFQSIYGWLTTGAVWLERGYSVMSFIGLYMLGRYVRLYPSSAFEMPRKLDMLIYWAIVIVQTLVLYWMIRTGCSNDTLDKVFRLTSPIVIAEALYLMLYFSKLNFQNKFVNWMAGSCFAVFLIQQNPYFGKPVYAATIKHIYASQSGPACVLLIGLFILVIFAASILIDQLWKAVDRKVFARR